MKCRELVNKMESVNATLAAHGLVPIMEHFWFTGEHLVTYNDKLGMQVPCQTDFAGAVPSRLLQLCKVSDQEKEVTFEFGDTDFDMHIGRNIGTFPYLPIDDTAEVFTMPALGKEADASSSSLEILRFALEAALLSVATSTEKPERLGVTFAPSGKDLILYSSNNDTFTRAIISSGEGSLTAPVVVPANFIRIFLDLTKGIKAENRAEQNSEGPKKKEKVAVHLQLNKKYVLAKVGDTLLYGAMIQVDQPTDFKSIFDKYCTKAYVDRMIEVPSTLETCVNRALVVTESDVDQEKSQLTVADNKLNYLSETKRGTIDDEITFKHPDIGPVKLMSKLLKIGLETYDRITITDRAVILSNSICVYMISTTG
jgi:hypothetical protein